MPQPKQPWIGATDSPGTPEAALRQRVAGAAATAVPTGTGCAAEAKGDLASAEQLLNEARGTGPAAPARRRRVAAGQRCAPEQRFNDAMSEGYAALDAGRFDAARKAFRSAAALQQGSTEAASALQEVGAAETAYRLSSLKQKGDQFEQQEQWQAGGRCLRKGAKD